MSRQHADPTCRIGPTFGQNRSNKWFRNMDIQEAVSILCMLLSDVQNRRLHREKFFAVRPSGVSPHESGRFTSFRKLGIFDTSWNLPSWARMWCHGAPSFLLGVCTQEYFLSMFQLMRQLMGSPQISPCTLAFDLYLTRWAKSSHRFATAP